MIKKLEGRNDKKAILMIIFTDGYLQSEKAWHPPRGESR